MDNSQFDDSHADARRQVTIVGSINAWHHKQRSSKTPKISDFDTRDRINRLKFCASFQILRPFSNVAPVLRRGNVRVWLFCVRPAMDYP